MILLPCPSISFELGSKWAKTGIVVQYAAFCDKYASVLIRQRKLQEFYKMHPGKGLFDKLHYLDKAYICLIIRNDQGMWTHQYREKGARERNATSSQKATTTRKRSCANSTTKKDNNNLDTSFLTTTEWPRPLWTGFKTSSKIAYPSSWNQEGEEFYKKTENKCQCRTKEWTADLHKI